MSDSAKYAGYDNYGQPKAVFVNALAMLNNTELHDKTADCIYWSAWARNNPKADFHWQVDACYDECKRRFREDLYEKAWEQARRKGVKMSIISLETQAKIEQLVKNRGFRMVSTHVGDGVGGPYYELTVGRGHLTWSISYDVHGLRLGSAPGTPLELEDFNEFAVDTADVRSLLHAMGEIFAHAARKMTPFDELYNTAVEMAGDTDGKIVLKSTNDSAEISTLLVRHTTQPAVTVATLRIHKNGRAYIKDMADPPYHTNAAFRAYAELCAFTADLLETFNGE